MTQQQNTIRDNFWYEKGYKQGCKDSYNYTMKHSYLGGCFGIAADESYKQGYLKGYNDYELYRFGHISKLEF